MKSYPTVERCLRELHKIPTGGRGIHWIVEHHTFAPDHRQWQGEKSVKGMLDYWKRRQRAERWTYPPGGHFVIAPDGGIWLPFNDLVLPLNANSDLMVNRRGVALEIVGNLDKGHDTLEGAQKHAVLALTAGLLRRFKLGVEAVTFHRDYTDTKSCPGTSLDRTEFRQWVSNALKWLEKQAN